MILGLAVALLVPPLTRGAARLGLAFWRNGRLCQSGRPSFRRRLGGHVHLSVALFEFPRLAGDAPQLAACAAGSAVRRRWVHTSRGNGRLCRHGRPDSGEQCAHGGGKTDRRGAVLLLTYLQVGVGRGPRTMGPLLIRSRVARFLRRSRADGWSSQRGTPTGLEGRSSLGHT